MKNSTCEIPTWLQLRSKEDRPSQAQSHLAFSAIVGGCISSKHPPMEPGQRPGLAGGGRQHAPNEGPTFPQAALPVQPLALLSATVSWLAWPPLTARPAGHSQPPATSASCRSWGHPVQSNDSVSAESTTVPSAGEKKTVCFKVTRGTRGRWLHYVQTQGRLCWCHATGS